MKSISTFFIAAIALLAISCSSKTAQNEAEATVEAISVDELLTNASELTDSLVTIEGVCTHTCRHGATKMFLIGSDNTKTLRVEAGELKSFRPEVINSLVNVTGYLREQRIDEDYLSNWENRLMADEAQQQGENGAGCETERASRGVASETTEGQIAEYRQRLADKIANGGNPWLSFYYFVATDYEVK